MKTGLASGAFFDGYLLLLAILLVQSILDIRTLRRTQWAERGVMEPTDEKKALKNQVIIEVHFALSLIAMLFAHLLMYKWWKAVSTS